MLVYQRVDRDDLDEFTHSLQVSTGSLLRCIRPGQKGFFARPPRESETLTFVERQEQGDLPFDRDKKKDGKRQRRKDKLPDGVLDHNVDSVMQELRWKPRVFAFMLFPLFFDFRFDFLDIWLMILIEVFDT